MYKDIKSISELKVGDIIKHKGTFRDPYVIMANYGDRATAVRTVDVTNPIEWELFISDLPEDNTTQTEQTLPPESKPLKPGEYLLSTGPKSE